MKTLKLNYNPARDAYCGKISLKSEDTKKETSIFVCVSFEYLGKVMKLSNMKDAKVNKWSENIVKEWQNKGGKIFHKPYHYDVRAVTSDGEKNGLKFLREEAFTI